MQIEIKYKCWEKAADRRKYNKRKGDSLIDEPPRPRLTIMWNMVGSTIKHTIEGTVTGFMYDVDAKYCSRINASYITSMNGFFDMLEQECHGNMEEYVKAIVADDVKRIEDKNKHLNEAKALDEKAQGILTHDWKTTTVETNELRKIYEAVQDTYQY